MEQQKILAKIMVDLFKDKLAMPMPIPAGGIVAQLPSPMELKYKILIKGKRLADHAHEEEEEEEEEEEDDEGKGKNDKDAAAAAAGEKSSSKKKKNKNKTHPDLSNITYLGTGKVKGFTEEIRNSTPADNMASYSEPTTFKNLKNPDKVEGWIEHNKEHLR